MSSKFFAILGIFVLTELAFGQQEIMPIERNLNLVISRMLEDDALLRIQQNFALSMVCTEGGNLSPYVHEALRQLRSNEVWMEEKGQPVRLQADNNWGYMVKVDKRTGLKNVVVDSVFYKNPDGSLTGFDIVFAACENNTFLLRSATRFPEFSPGDLEIGDYRRYWSDKELPTLPQNGRPEEVAPRVRR